jgi:hypothetical protein
MYANYVCFLVGAIVLTIKIYSTGVSALVAAI